MDLLEDLRKVYSQSLDVVSLNLRVNTPQPRPEPPNPNGPNRVMMIWGMRALNTGPLRERQEPNTENVVFRRNSTRTMDIWPVEQLNAIDNQAVYARTPLLFRRGDNLNIEFTPRHADQPTDNLMLMGTVVEALGQTVTGGDDTSWVTPIPLARCRSAKSPEQIAHELLLSYLDREDKRRWINEHVILVPSKIRPAFTYRIRPRGTVHLLNRKGVPIEEFCLVSGRDGDVPPSDLVLSKYLMLQSSEERFLRIANRTVLRTQEERQEAAWEFERPQPIDARARLEARRDAVNLDRIGLQGGIYEGFTPIETRALEDAVVRYGVAQALMDGIANEPAGLAVRDILPDRDLQWHDPNNPNNPRPSISREWRSPVNG